MTPGMVVDTNVLEHAFDRVINADGHVERLLRKFTEQKRKLCIDRVAPEGGSRILAEYKHRLQFRLRAMDEQGQVTQWVRYLLNFAERVETKVNLTDQLGKLIVPLMNRVEAERSDQHFVYVACALNSVMVSNNSCHVTDLRNALRRAARKVGSNDTDFLSSLQAEAGM
jgi:hypothetical protein